eukprot:1152346-Pelagomonas_calceolata.AAC.14
MPVLQHNQSSRACWKQQNCVGNMPSLVSAGPSSQVCPSAAAWEQQSMSKATRPFGPSLPNMAVCSSIEAAAHV